MSRGELAEKNHTVKMAILQAELAVSSEARALEFALQLARHRVEHEDWMAGLTPQGRELYRQSKADLESAVGPTKVGPAGIREPSKFLPPEYTGDEWVDRQIDVGWRRQSDRRRKVFQSTSSSLRAEPKLVPFVKDELTKLGREDVWAQVNY